MTFLKQLRSEWNRGLGRPVEKYVSLVAIALAAVMPILMTLFSLRDPNLHRSTLTTLTFPNSLAAVRTATMLFGPFFVAALGANAMGAEYQYGTWPWLLVRSRGRLQIVAVKLVTLVLRMAVITIAATATFLAIAAVIRMIAGEPVAGGMPAAKAMIFPYVNLVGSMALAAIVGFVVTVASRSVAFGSIAGAFMLPLLSALRFKETAAWIPYVHLDNLTTRLITGKPAPYLKALYDFDWSARASAGVFTLEIAVLLAVAYVIFKRQEIVY